MVSYGWQYTGGPIGKGIVSEKGDGRVVLEERLLNRLAGRVRAIAPGPDALLYIGTDDGHIFRLRPAER